jgi:hypothetical protein
MSRDIPPVDYEARDRTVLAAAAADPPPPPPWPVAPPWSAHDKAIAKAIWIGFVVILVVGYLAFHSMKYTNCYFQPGILEWPSVCL